MSEAKSLPVFFTANGRSAGHGNVSFMLSLLGRRSPVRAAGRNNPLIRYAGNGARLDYCRELVPLGLDQVRGLRRGRSLDAHSIRNIINRADRPQPPPLIDPRGI